MNIVDLIIILSLIGYIILGYYQGFIKVLIEIFGFILALMVSFSFYPEAASFLASHFKIQESFANILGFFVIWMFIDGLYLIGAQIVYRHFPTKITESTVNKAGGIAASFIKAFIMIAIIVTLVVSLPVSGPIKTKVLASSIAPFLVSKTQRYEGDIQKLFGRAIKDSLTYFMVKPKENEKIDLKFTQTEVMADRKSEEDMLELLNEERSKNNLKPLSMELQLREVARTHSKDMFAKGYFAHENLEGKTPFDRMEAAGIDYEYAGENLALAPNVEMAHAGL